MNSLKYVIILFLVGFSTQAQKRLPTVLIESLQRRNLSAPEIANADGPTVISFWATWCKPCLRELGAINANLANWQRQTNVKFIAISTDDARTKGRVPAFVKSKQWQFDVYVDPNGDLQRAMNVLSIPYTIILNKNGDIIYQHTSYAVGDENVYFEILKNLW